VAVSTEELDSVAQQLLDMLEYRISSGTVTIHFNEGKAMMVTSNPTLWKRRSDSREPLVKPRV
jgi:hypothetical protein